MGSVFVHTLGDSTLDNLYWMLNQDGSNLEEAKQNSVEGQLQTCLGSDNYEVVSHAYDGFTTASIHDGDHVGRVLGIRPGYVFDKRAAYLIGKNITPTLKNFSIHPLDALKSSINEHPDGIHYVVISVGGNDFRERLFSPVAMLQEIPHIHERYLKLLSEVKLLGTLRNIRPIIMLQYRLDANDDCYGIYRILKVVGGIFASMQALGTVGIALSVGLVAAGKISLIAAAVLGIASIATLYLSSRIIPFKVTLGLLQGKDLGMASLGGLMETFYRPILERAKQDGIPVLDLPNTFDPNAPLYTHQIEPNKQGGTVIAEGLSHIILNHDYSTPSMLYAKKANDNNYSPTLNPGATGWQVN